MKKNALQILVSIILLMILNTSVSAQSKITAQTISAAATKIEPKVIAWRHDFHQNPELGNR